MTNTMLQDERLKRVKSYRSRHDNQFGFYEKKSSFNKCLYNFIGLSIISLGALTSVISVLGLDGPTQPPGLTEKILAGIGAVIVILKGVERLWLPEEKWVNYRKAAESMRRESQLYVENISPYTSLDEEEAYSLFVSRCLKIQAEEESNFWGMNDENT